MSDKQLTVDGRSWGVEDAQAAEVNRAVQQAMTDGVVVALPVLKEDGSPVTLYLNGKLATTAVFDNGAGGRPTEIPG
ncbi:MULTISPECIES: hypothetical protein [unclassified Kutzneria]|uniref:hypothetical protein n=1 Tax=unclassified Kutzneria TaxID=2621979 RepID=UPI0003EEA3B1|nr:hypothetical protein [Kutzneria sp. 744]EWM12167.1 hypothetical protein KUTG_02471 [Kutzneria sp. 744]